VRDAHELHKIHIEPRAEKKKKKKKIVSPKAKPEEMATLRPGATTLQPNGFKKFSSQDMQRGYSDII
jgi:hypothetical protein